MLLSSVIHLQALESAALPADSGRALNAEFLRWVSEADSRLGDQLHNGNGVRPYTVSDLNGAFEFERGFRKVQGGQSAWMRVTSLTESLSEAMQEKIVPRLEAGEIFQIERARWKVTRVAGEEASDVWAGSTSFQRLVERHMTASASPPEILQMEFASPTTFHSSGKHSPFPLPENVFESWLNRWNTFAPTGLPLEIRPFAQLSVGLSEFSLQSRAVHTGKATLIGFVGHCKFRILQDDPYWLRLLNLLADFSFYCGTGAKTSFGLGQTRRVNTMERTNLRSR